MAVSTTAQAILNSGFAQWINLYERKREDAHRRGVAFNLSLEEFVYAREQAEKHNVCDYTGKEFSKRRDNDGKTIERIDATKGYEVGNICFVTYQVNGLKGEAIDKQMRSKFTDEEKVILGQIRAVLNNKKQLDQIRMKYIPKNHPLYIQMQQSMTEQKENKVVPIKPEKQEEVTVAAPTNSKAASHKDVRLAHAYIKLSNAIEKDGVDFDLSFNQFTVKCKRKTCSLTKRELSSPYIMRVNKDHSFNDKNILVVDRTIADALSSFLDTTGLSLSDFRKVANRLDEANRFVLNNQDNNN